MKTAEFVRLREGLPEPVEARMQRADRCVLRGREVIEIVVSGEPLRLAGRRAEEAIEALQCLTQQWAVSHGAPTTFFGVPVLYRTQDCCEAAGNKSEDFDVWLDGALIATALAMVRAGQSCRLFARDLPFSWEVYGHCAPPGETTAFAVHLDYLPTGTDAEVELAKASQMEERTEQIADDALGLVGAVILLSPLFSAKFAADFGDVIREARDIVAKVPRFDELWRDFDDEESEAPVDFDGYAALSDAGERVAALFRRLLLAHRDEWLDIMARGSVNPMSLGLEPRAENFLPDRD